ncbi:MAG TPA: hypothetical protein VGR03_03000 [Candidatus Acidoferrum sp.]|nr:hypothetical protein [Candidatus Acidoferrum sp.]
MKLRVVLYCLLGGLPVTIAALGAGHFVWWWLSGILFAASFVPVALFGPKKAPGQFGVIIPVLLIVTMLCTWSEALIFVPGYSQHAGRDLFGSVVMYLIVAAVLALLAASLKMPKPGEPDSQHRTSVSAAFMILVSGLSYLFYYLIFGGITYQFFTKGYYPEATQAVARLGLWFWVIQFARGVLMTFAVVPIIYTLRMKRWHAAVAVGSIIWITGGAGPLLVPNGLMGTTQRFIYIVEIFTQNASLGVTAVLLLRPKSVSDAANPPAA